MPTSVDSHGEQPNPATATIAPARRFPVLVGIVLTAAILGCAFYGKLNANLHSENFNIARALVAGDGYANAIGAPSGPTAWSAPVYPLLQAGLLWIGSGSHAFVQGVLVVLHLGTLIATGLLVLTLVQQTTHRIPASIAAAIFFLGLVYHFWNWFQIAQDCWLIMLTLDLLVGGFCWLRPLNHWGRAAGWGVVGGFCALTNPSVGLVWGVLSLVFALRQGVWSRAGIAVLFAALTLSPWIIRNYLVFGRFIPVKSNLAYELYQTHCLQKDGLLQSKTAPLHPSSAASQERREYLALGEMAFLDRKWQQFNEVFNADPEDFLDRVAERFLGATLWYVSHNRASEQGQPWLLWGRRLTHPLPFLAMVLLLFSGIRAPLLWPQWTVLGIYVLYLLPYVAASYYERYAVPLDAVKVLMVVWAIDRLLPLRGATGNSPTDSLRSESSWDGSDSKPTTSS